MNKKALIYEKKFKTKNSSQKLWNFRQNLTSKSQIIWTGSRTNMLNKCGKSTESWRQASPFRWWATKCTLKTFPCNSSAPLNPLNHFENLTLFRTKQLTLFLQNFTLQSQLLRISPSSKKTSKKTLNIWTQNTEERNAS